jgi:hypothetical protein
VDHALGLIDIRDRDSGHAAFLVCKHDLAALHRCGQSAAFNGFERRLSIAFLDELGQILRTDFAGNDMVGENLGQLILVFRLQQSVDSAGRQFAEGLIGWRKDCEGAGHPAGWAPVRLP